MRIHDSNLNGIGSSQLGRTQETEALGRQGRGRGAGAAGEGGDRVQLSTLAGALRSEEAASPERQVLIEKLGAEYQLGEYRADAAEVSRRMVDDAIADQS